MTLTLKPYFSLVRFSHSIFALPLAGIALVQALPLSSFAQSQNHTAGWLLSGKILLCMLSLRSAAMAFNRILDRDYDAANPRTSQREIPAGLISTAQAKVFMLMSSLLFLLSAFSINKLTSFFAVPVLALAGAYSYAKRYTYLAHFFLGSVIGLAPLAVWIAVLERIDLLPVLWSLGLLFYIAGFDILYACQDYDFDKKNALHSIPARFGLQKALHIAPLCHAAALCFFFAAGWLGESHFVFYIALAVVASLFIVEHLLVRPRKLQHIHLAFFHINASISSILFLGLVLSLYLQS